MVGGFEMSSNVRPFRPLHTYYQNVDPFLQTKNPLIEWTRHWMKYKQRPLEDTKPTRHYAELYKEETREAGATSKSVGGRN